MNHDEKIPPAMFKQLMRARYATVVVDFQNHLPGDILCAREYFPAANRISDRTCSFQILSADHHGSRTTLSLRNYDNPGADGHVRLEKPDSHWRKNGKVLYSLESGLVVEDELGERHYVSDTVVSGVCEEGTIGVLEYTYRGWAFTKNQHGQK